MSNNRNPKKTFALLTVPNNEKILEILTFNDALIISNNKYAGNNFLENASIYLLELKNGKNLEGVILDFYCHEDSAFLNQIRKYFSEFCETKVILFRLVYQNVIFTSMLLYHSDLDFTPDDTVYAIWIKNDSLVSYILKRNTLYFIHEMKIEDDFAVNTKYNALFHPKCPPKFLILGSFSSDDRLKKLKNVFKASKTKVMFCTYEDCLKKSASHYLSRFIRAKDWRWNFQLSESTTPKLKPDPVDTKPFKVFIAKLFFSMIAFIVLAIAAAALISSNSFMETTVVENKMEKEPVEGSKTVEIDVGEFIQGLMKDGSCIKINEKLITNEVIRKKLLEWQDSVNDLIQSLRLLEELTTTLTTKKKQCGGGDFDEDAVERKNNKIKGKNRSNSVKQNIF